MLASTTAADEDWYDPDTARVSSMALKVYSQEVGASLAGRTVTAVVRELAGVSHSIARGLVDEGLVKINGRPASDPVKRLAAGDRIEVRLDPGTRYHPHRERRETPRTHGFSLLLEDDHLVVVDKEAGLITVPAPSHPDDSLADRLVEMYVSRGFRAPRLWVVHRIDRYTSGLVLFARTAPAALALIEQFERRTARREYVAVCEGIPDASEGRIVSWLVENPRSLKVTETRDRARGRRAALAYRVEERLAGAALLRVTLDTGRRHQIRVQLAGAGHPLLGDRAYGRPHDFIERVALHAARLGFEHPRTGRPVRVESPLPEDMIYLVRRLRQPRSRPGAPT